MGGHNFPVRVECPRCGLTLVAIQSVTGFRDPVADWNRLAGLRLALERIAVTDQVCQLAPVAAVQHVAEIARKALAP